MALIGLGAVTLVSVIVYARSNSVLNKAGVGCMWLAYAAITAGLVA